MDQNADLGRNSRVPSLTCSRFLAVMALATTCPLPDTALTMWSLLLSKGA